MAGGAAMDQLNVIAWEGRTDTAEGGVDAGRAAEIHATLGDAGRPAPKTGEALPPLWHWCAFPVTAPMAELGTDGHPILGDFLPPVRLERRMWAGGALRFGAAARVGEPLTRRSTLSRVVEKSGAAGPMVFVTVDHEIRGTRGVVLNERQDIVYLEKPTVFEPPTKRPMPEAPVLTRQVEMSAPLLFRYSAITFNAHRIHYDLAYTRAVEMYPDLVVHGPLQATLLMQAAMAHRGDTPAEFHFRGVHPMFVDAPLQIAATEDEAGALRLCTGQGGHQGMQATAIWQGTV